MFDWCFDKCVFISRYKIVKPVTLSYIAYRRKRTNRLSQFYLCTSRNKRDRIEQVDSAEARETWIPRLV